MKPVAFEGCFGWMHDASGNTGVVLCGAYGHEAVWAHRSWRGLAEHLSDNHIPTLRFDYRGTGDSLESEENGERVEAWLDSIRAAVHYLRQQNNVKRVVLCGIRVGGLLASMAAERLADIDGLILMAPVVSGREHIRELKLIQRRWRNTSAPLIAVDEVAPGVIETVGFRLNQATAARLEGLSLLKDAAPAIGHVLILDPVKVQAADKLRDRYVAMGAQVDVSVFTDYTHVISESIAAPVPHETYTKVSAWIAEAFSVSLNAKALNQDVSGAMPQLAGEGFIETPVIFGAGRLFGVYCQPVSGWGAADQTEASDTADSAPLDALANKVQSGDLADAGDYAVLFSNTARSHHIGEARMWVTQARRLARQGIASLRMDIGLLGDSAQAATSVTVADLHAQQSVNDVSIGIDWLVGAGHKRPTAVGICSGAFLTLHAASDNPRVAGVTLINQREYFWAEGREQALGPAIASTAVYMQSMRSGDKWKRLIKGQIPVATIAKGLLARRAKQWKAKAAYLTSAIGGAPSAKRIVRAKFVALADRGVDVRVLYGAFDEGLEEAATFLNKDFQWLKRLPQVRAATSTAVDHALFLYPAREQMMDAVEQQLYAQRVQDADIQKADRRAGFFGVQRKPVIEKMPEIKNYWVQGQTGQMGH